MADNNDALAFFDNIIHTGATTKSVDHVQKVLDGITEQRKIAEKMIKEKQKVFSKFDWATAINGPNGLVYKVKIGHFPITIGKGSSWEVKSIEDVIKVYDMAEKVIKEDIGGIRAAIIKRAEERGKRISENKGKKA
ncbi:hypothetical protein [Agrobacterium tumefaciens]|uniref:Uncharacterized protein n=1 Tax=Agrobacterium tumefaciens TaxID=358 RepID=A0AA44F8N4_AGRTU|nr:hypothetical protein [Agrobacterium tumefaciens]NTB86846.1 hypothetical protein [Agrobacterium tumefaciens]NTC21175.1 hypothetical protein [Agrobacterium tumefaciens]NTC30723.1 hypothetical protein [Agrobacterium tumefaciens]